MIKQPKDWTKELRSALKAKDWNRINMALVHGADLDAVMDKKELAVWVKQAHAEDELGDCLNEQAGYEELE